MTEVSRIRALVVDDVRGSVAVLREMLREIGILEVEEAYDGKEALEKLHAAPFDLVISDYAMRSMSGLYLLHALQSNPDLKSIPFLMVSAKSDFQVMEEALQVGAVAYIFKPVDFLLLKNAVLSLLSRSLCGLLPAR